MKEAPQFGVSTWNYLKPLGERANLMQAVQEIKSQEFGIELWLNWSADPAAFDRSKWSHLKEICRNPVGLSAHSRLTQFFELSVIKEEIDLCEAIEASPLVVHPRSLGIDVGTWDARAPQSLNSYDMDPVYEIVSYAAEKQVLLALENGSLDVLRHVLDAFDNHPDKESIKICIDTGHANLHHALYDSPVQRFLEEFKNSLTQVHVSDNWGEADDHNLPEEGTVDWNGVLQTLTDIQYRGNFIFELNTSNPSTAGQLAREYFMRHTFAFRERTLLTLSHQEADRVPIDFWASSGTKQKIESDLGISYQRFLDENDVDLRYIEGPSYIGPNIDEDQGSVDTDIWGVKRRRVQVTLHDGMREGSESYREVSESPLANMNNIDEILEYDHWPSADWFDYSIIENQCREVREAERIVVFMGDRLNRIAQLKPAMYLRGMEQIYIDMIENPEIAGAIFQKISEFYLEYEQRMLEAARGMIDILCTGDDFGSQNGLLISPAMWNTFLREGFQKFVSLGKEGGARVMHHTCGSVYGIIPDLIDCGLDILQSLQPEALDMEPVKLKTNFGDQLCFQGGVSIQSVLPRGNRQDVKNHVRSVFEGMASGGGYIACTSHNIQADTPLSNIEALFEAYREYGPY